MSNPANVVNFSAYIGTDVTLQDTIYQADGVNPQNITSWSITFTIEAYQDSGTVFVTKTVGAGITITNGPGGVLSIAILRADTLGMLAGQYSYRIERTDSGNDAVPTIGLFSLLAK